MKRLIKKSEIYDGMKVSDTYFEIYQNPTDNEIAMIKKNSYKSIRGIITDDGAIYAWPGQFLHSNVVSKVPDGFRFAFDGEWIFDAHLDYKIDEMLNKISQYRTILSRFGNTVDSEIFVCNAIGNRSSMDATFEDIDEMIQYFNRKIASFNKKHAKMYDSFVDMDENKKYVEVFVNPSSKEIKDTKSNDPFGSIRGLIDNGTIYCWPGYILHDSINDYLSTAINIDNGLRFAFEGDEWTIDLNYSYTFNEGVSMVRKYKDTLSQFGDINIKFELYFSSDKQVNQTFESGEIFQQPVAAGLKLNKTAEFVHCHNCGWDNGDFMKNDDGTLQGWVPKPDTKSFKKLDEKQIYKSRKEYDEKNPDRICPICGKQELDTD